MGKFKWLRRTPPRRCCLFSALVKMFFFGRPLFFLSLLGRPPADCDLNSSQTVHFGSVWGSHLYTSSGLSFCIFEKQREGGWISAESVVILMFMPVQNASFYAAQAYQYALSLKGREQS